ncbi:MAG: penicillin-binding protein 2 [Dehalococcoidia bacterium]|nr:penicillin-binding protein 2 [Dehalococcoidia bacterium]
MANRRPSQLNWRHRALSAVVALAFVALIARLAMVQLVDHERYVEEAAVARLGAASLPAPRGAILDATGFPLANSVDTWDLYIDASLWRDAERAERAAQQLAAFLGGGANARELLTAGTEVRQGDVLVRRQLAYAAGRELQALDILGVRLLPAARRLYPEGDLAASIIGYLGLDGGGLWGVEADFDQLLRGKPGLRRFERDALGRPISFNSRSEREPEPGGEVQLTIDRFIQAIAERRLREAVTQYHASGGSILVMDPHTGALLAMASMPTTGLGGIDLDDPKLAERVRNRALTDLYEPGSVLKAITTAAAIDLGKVTPESTYVDTGRFDVAGSTTKITNWDFSANGRVTVRQYLQRSLNTGAVWLSEQIGARDFYNYLHAFGFGESTHVGLAGEAEGLIREPADPAWYPVDLATNSYGQGLATTPLQVLTAVNVFANGGRLMRPYVVSQLVTDREVRRFEPVEVRRPVSEATAKTVGRLMLDVVEGVEWHGARVRGYLVAGKTGTTLVSIPTGYDLNMTIATFAGFLPYEQPRVSILVKIDQPSGGLNLGGQVAAPVFANVAADIMQYLNVPPAIAPAREAAAR